MLKLETERLIVRNWLEEDVGFYRLLAHDVGYNCFAPPGRFLVHSDAEAREKIRERIVLYDQQRLGKFPVFLRGSGEFVGTCGMEPFQLGGRMEVELGYRLCLNHWGRGYATEAATALLRYGFGPLRLDTILAFALPQNRASLKVLDKLGFHYLREFSHAGLPHKLYEVRREKASE